MSSVVVAWTGRCPDPAARARLIGHLRRLAETSDTFLRTRLPQPAFGLNRRRAGAEFGRANIEWLSQPISGQILISSDVLPGRKDVARRDQARVDIREAGQASMTMLHDARLSGIDFKLYDPRGLYPGADRLSFVFLETGEAPELDGRLVHLAPTRGTRVYLDAPSIELRSYLEDWTDLLFSWVKYFFVEDLAWRRREAMQGYDDYLDVFVDVETALGRERAEVQTFDAILATFAQHAEHWSEEVAASAGA